MRNLEPVSLCVSMEEKALELDCLQKNIGVRVILLSLTEKGRPRHDELGGKGFALLPLMQNVSSTSNA